MQRTLDRIAQFDDRSRGYPVRSLISATGLESKSWTCKPRLDQGAEGACVGFGWTHELAARPVVVTEASNTMAFAVYRLAKSLDVWPGEDYEGTSVLAGAKAVKHMGYLDEYRWAFGIDDVLMTLSHFGPVVLGLNWYEGMFEPDARGFIHPTGELLGGHCILARGIAVGRGYVRLRNSWGIGWGEDGDCKIKFSDLDALLQQDGEACVPVRRLNP